MPNGARATLVSPSAAILTIIDDESPGSLSFSTESYTVDEAAGSISFKVRRTGGALGAASVRCDAEGVTATEPGDFTAPMPTLDWEHGDRTDRTCTVTILDDSDAEGDETVRLSLIGESGADLGSPSTAILTIVDNDSADVLSFSTSIYEVDEDARSALITVRRTGSLSGAVGARCATADGSAQHGLDYESATERLHWADGDGTDRTCKVRILDDNHVEGSETVMLSLVGLTGGVGQGSLSIATLTILDDDVFLDGFETGDTSRWTSERAGGVADPSPQGVELNVLGAAALECGSIQWAPAVETGSVRLRAPAVEELHLELSMADAAVLDLDVPTHAGELIEITGLRLTRYELEITVGDQSVARFSIELTAAAPCAVFELEPRDAVESSEASRENMD